MLGSKYCCLYGKCLKPQKSNISEKQQFDTDNAKFTNPYEGEEKLECGIGSTYELQPYRNGRSDISTKVYIPVLDEEDLTRRIRTVKFEGGKFDLLPGEGCFRFCHLLLLVLLLILLLFLLRLCDYLLAR